MACLTNVEKRNQEYFTYPSIFLKIIRPFSRKPSVKKATKNKLYQPDEDKDPGNWRWCTDLYLCQCLLGGKCVGPDGWMDGRVTVNRWRLWWIAATLNVKKGARTLSQNTGHTTALVFHYNCTGMTVNQKHFAKAASNVNCQLLCIETPPASMKVFTLSYSHVFVYFSFSYSSSKKQRLFCSNEEKNSLASKHPGLPAEQYEGTTKMHYVLILIITNILIYSVPVTSIMCMTIPTLPPSPISAALFPPLLGRRS